MESPTPESLVVYQREWEQTISNIGNGLIMAGGFLLFDGMARE
jgi:hypothetical protein